MSELQLAAREVKRRVYFYPREEREGYNCHGDATLRDHPEQQPRKIVFTTLAGKTER